MEPKLKKSHLNKIITKQIFVSSTSLLDHIPLSLNKKKNSLLWNLVGIKTAKKVGEEIGNPFVFAKIHTVTIFLILKLKLFGKFFK